MKFKSKYIVPIGCEGIYQLNTGDWRTRRPVMDKEKCSRCGICFLYCPVFSIEKKGGAFEINYDYCKGCAICAYECPEKAINMVPEEGE